MPSGCAPLPGRGVQGCSTSAYPHRPETMSAPPLHDVRVRYAALPELLHTRSPRLAEFLAE
eukprot:10873481-Alexandrium_andersonii.AAC.1